jgi:hypothetical protein
VGKYALHYHVDSNASVEDDPHNTTMACVTPITENAAGDLIPSTVAIYSDWKSSNRETIVEVPVGHSYWMFSGYQKHAVLSPSPDMKGRTAVVHFVSLTLSDPEVKNKLTDFFVRDPKKRTDDGVGAAIPTYTDAQAFVGGYYNTQKRTRGGGGGSRKKTKGNNK